MKLRGLTVLLALLLASAATGAVLLYVRGVEGQARTGAEDLVEVIVAREDIPAGTDLNPLIQQGAFTTRAFPRDLVLEGTVVSLSQLQGQRTGAAILAEEQIPMMRLRGEEEFGGGMLGIPEGLEAVTTHLDVSRAAGGILQDGDRVTIFATFQGTERGDVTVTLVPDVLVLRAERRGAGPEAGGTNETLLTLALRPRDAQRFVFAQEIGTVWLGLLPPNQEGTRQPPVTLGEVTP